MGWDETDMYCYGMGLDGTEKYVLWTSLAITLYYFSNKEKRQRIDRLSDMLSFVCFLLFNQSKKNAVLETRTGHFRGLEGFEVKVKDLSFETKAKTKDLKICPRCQRRP